MVESDVAEERDRRRSVAIRSLLAKPLLSGARDPDAFSAVVRERAWLMDWFEETLGWPLHVDVRGGWARLSKRSPRPDPTRPARRVRGGRHPFDRRRYQLLCLACAELVAQPLTTVGLLAGRVAAASATTENMIRFDSAHASERSAFVDALKLLEHWDVVAFSAGDVDAYVASESGNALLDVDGSRLHRLLACARAPSSLAIPQDASPGDVVAALCREPRYGENAAVAEDPAVRTRWIRHSLARGLLDDPVVYDADLSAAERDYLDNPSGRRWLRERATAAGFILEERREGRLAIDRDHIATDDRFPAPNESAKQTALLLVDRFTFADGSTRRLVDVTPADVEAHIRELLRVHSGWAKQYRSGDGPARLAEAAIDVLERFRLVRRDGDVVRALPALARYRADPPAPSSGPERKPT